MHSYETEAKGKQDRETEKAETGGTYEESDYTSHEIMNMTITIVGIKKRIRVYEECKNVINALSPNTMKYAELA